MISQNSYFSAQKYAIQSTFRLCAIESFDKDIFIRIFYREELLLNH